MVHEAMRTAVSDVRRASDALASERATADRRVSGLLGSGWTGVAADSFSETWEDWKTAADQVRSGLDAMAQLLDAVHRDLVSQDDASQQSLDQISQRIVNRLS